MAQQHGGYRRPEEPAPVSGPGALSRRTDGGPGGQPVRAMTGGAYGEGVAMQGIQGGAAMSSSQGGPAAPGGGAAQGGGLAGLMAQAMQGAGPQPTPFDAPSQRPGEPVTAGSDMGPGPGASSLMLGPDAQAAGSEDIAAMRRDLPVLVALASQPGASAAFKVWVRTMKSRV